MIPRALLALVVESDGASFYAWTVLNSEVVIYSVYLVDSDKPDDTYTGQLVELGVAVRKHQAQGLAVVLCGDLQVQLPPDVPDLTGCRALGRLATPQQVRRVGDLLEFMSTCKLKASSTFPSSMYGDGGHQPLRSELCTFYPYGVRGHLFARQLDYVLTSTGVEASTFVHREPFLQSDHRPLYASARGAMNRIPVVPFVRNRKGWSVDDPLEHRKFRQAAVASVAKASADLDSWQRDLSDAANMVKATTLSQRATQAAKKPAALTTLECSVRACFNPLRRKALVKAVKKHRRAWQGRVALSALDGRKGRSEAARHTLGGEKPPWSQHLGKDERRTEEPANVRTHGARQGQAS